MNQINIVEKDKFIVSLIKECEEMMYENPKCDFEHHWNLTIEKVVENIKTFYDNNPEENVEVEVK